MNATENQVKQILVGISPEHFVDELRTLGVDFFCGVPDSLLKSFCAYLTDMCEHTITANEGGAIALAAGHYLATGKLGLVYMQNSGEGNAINPLLSLADSDVYSIPLVMLIGWRGEPGIKDEPQHVKQGKVTLSLLDTLGIRYIVLPKNEKEAFEDVRGIIGEAVMESCPVAIIVHKDTFCEHRLQKKNPENTSLLRENAIEEILASIPDNAVVVSTTGMISRELYEVRERLEQGHQCDFLTVGSMGHASQIALGIAKALPKRPVVCIDGDGASIMHLGNMAIVGTSQCANLTHYVLNNHAHDSVGGQPTASIDLSSIALACGYNKPGAPVFHEIQVKKGARSNIGRPKESPRVNKALFMKYLGSCK